MYGYQMNDKCFKTQARKVLRTKTTFTTGYFILPTNSTKKAVYIQFAMALSLQSLSLRMYYVHG